MAKEEIEVVETPEYENINEMINDRFVDLENFKLPSLEDFECFKYLSTCDAESNGASRLSKKNNSYDLHKFTVNIRARNTDEEKSESSMKSSGSLNFFRVSLETEMTNAHTMYHMLHDNDFRKEWDGYMTHGFNIIKVRDYADIGFYGVKLPFMGFRYSVAERVWHQWNDHEFVIFNHSVLEPPCTKQVYQQNEYERKSSDIKILSYVSGYYMVDLPDSNKMKFVYITCSDIQSIIPPWAMNLVLKNQIPKQVDKLIRQASKYQEWRNNNERGDIPHWDIELAISEKSNRYPILSSEALSLLK